MKKIAIVVIILVVVVVGGLFLMSRLGGYAYSYPPMTKNISEMAAVSEFIVLGTPTGKVEILKVDQHLNFILTEIRIESVIQGQVREGETFKILQTENVPADIKLQTNKPYILFLQSYMPGIKDAAGTYVTTQANQGIYLVDKDGTFTEYNIEGQSTDAGDRTSQIQLLFAEILPSVIAKVE